MKLVKSSNHKSWIEMVLNKNAEKSTDLTFNEERIAAENQAVDFEQKRKAQASKFPSLASSEENKPGFRAEVTDENKVIEAASRILIDRISELFGKKRNARNKQRKASMAGVELSPEEFRTIEAHKDIVDGSKIHDKALISFAIKFTLPGLNKFKTAKFVVSYDENSDNKFTVGDRFYDEKLNEYELTTANLEKFLTDAENETVKKASSEKPLVWFNPVEDKIQAVPVESSSKIASRLKSAGFDVDENYWVDRCYGMNWGKICVFASVPMNRVAEFEKIAAWSDEEWKNRGGEKGKEAKDKGMPGEKWVGRTDEKGSYDHMELDKGEKWVGRTQEKGPANPYGSEAKIMQSGTKSTKEIVAESLKDANKPAATETILDRLENLEKNLGQ